MLGNTNLKLKNYAVCRNYFKALYLLDTTSNYPLQKNAYSFQLENKVDSALFFYRKAHEKDSSDLSSIIPIANILHASGNAEEALKYVERGLLLYPENISLFKKKGNLLFDLQRYSEAILAFEKVIEGGDTTFTIMRELGISYHMDILYRDKAVALLSSLNESHSDDFVTAFYYGLALRSNYQLKESKEMIEKVIDLLLPNQLTLYYVELGNTCVLLEENNNTVEAYKKALEYSPGRKEILLEIAVIYEVKLKDLNKALSYQQQFLEEYKGSDKELIEYSEDKVKRLKEEIFFKGSGKK